MSTTDTGHLLEGMRKHVTTMPDSMLLLVVSRWQREIGWMEDVGGWRYSRASLKRAVQAGLEECMARKLTYGAVA